jgi:hypothetical protein
VFLSYQQTIGTTPTACIRFAVLSRIEILHILLEHSYDSPRNKDAELSSPTSSATASREKPGSVQSAPTVPAAACRRRIGCTLVAKDPGGLPRLRRSWQGPPAGRAGSRIPGALLAAAATGRCSCGVGHRPSGRLPPTSHTDIVVPVAFSPGRTLVAGGWDKSVLLWDVALT